MTAAQTRKVVINACYGGFSLSHAAVMEYAARKGIQVYPEADPITVKHFGALTVENATEYRGSINYYKVPPEQYHECSEKWRAEDGDYKRINSMDWYFSSRDVARDDPDLLAVVEELGDAASGRFAKLRIVEIPVDVEWSVEEYDGLEHIAEVHQTWA
jgi:hypothetical protein